MKNILVIGGSYFAGRVFTITASKEDCRLTLINRGNYSMRSFDGVSEFACDRHDYDAVSHLPLEESYDAVVDFCAYEQNDISGLVSRLPCGFKQYILISTSEVAAQTPQVRDENSPLELRPPRGPVERYSYQKMLLERELADCAGAHGFKYTVFRPVFIFGPYDYAPRESWYVQNIVQGQPVCHPTDSDAEFQMVYVKDIARAVLLAIGNPKAENQTYILSAPEIMTYERYLELLRAVSDIPFQVRPVSVRDVLEQNIPLPFPLRAEENKLFSGEKITRELGFRYSGLRQSMQLTYNAFKGVFAQMERP